MSTDIWSQPKIRVSREESVVDDALTLVESAYVKRGFCEASETGRRFILPYLNPGTLFVVAYDDDEPIGTIAMVREGPFGLPADPAFSREIRLLGREGGNLAEASGFVIADAWRPRTRALVGPLIGTALRIVVYRQLRPLFVMDPPQASFSARLLDCSYLIGPRDLIGAPGTLIAAPNRTQEEWIRLYENAEADGGVRRIVSPWILDPTPDWLTWDDDDHTWSDEWLAGLGVTAPDPASIDTLTRSH